MFILLDLIVVAIILLFTFLGYKQGLVKAAIKILSFFIAIIVALAMYKPISKIIINKTSIDDNIKSTIIDKLEVQEINSDDGLQLTNGITNKMVSGANSTIEEIAGEFSTKLIELAVLLIIFIVIRIIIRFISALTDLITKLPLIKQINKAGRNSIWLYKRYIDSLCNISSCLFNFSNDRNRQNKNN